MILNEKQLELIEEYASSLMSAAEIALLLGMNEDEADLFCETIKNHRNSPIYIYYNRGRLTTKYELRKKVIDLAKRGSPAAQPIAEKYMNEVNI